MKKLKTDRLILREWKKSDLDDFYEYCSVPGVGEMAGWPHHIDKEESMGILQSFIDSKTDIIYAIVLKESNKVIGSLGIHNGGMDPGFAADVQKTMGFVLSKDYWGRGLVPEAAKAAIEYTFEKLKANVLWIAHFDENMQSMRVIQKLGFTFYGKGKNEAKLLNKTFTEKRYLMTKNDYKLLSER